ncbi:NHL repeat domain protein [hydrothermal vent metagenome]|uniref:NHL repeat domain protein n=1 Tax=hydrothermal vent metagenome TaxID=652676 RepID=A0A3B1D5E4_9ZZZZ
MTSRSRFFKHGFLVLLIMVCSACAAAPVKEKPTIFWPKPPDAPKISFVDTWSKPADIGLKPSWFKRVVYFIFGEAKIPYVVRPSGVAVDGKGGVYVADTGLQVVHYFDEKNHKYHQLYQITQNERLQNPIGVAVDASGLLYVSDTDLNRIFVFNQDKKMVRVIGNDEKATRVSGLALDPVRERLYVVDTMGHQVLVYSLEGELLETIGKRGVEPGTFNFPTYATVDADGALYVADSLNFRIQIFDPEGRFQSQFGRLGRQLGEFSRPKGIAVDAQKNVYVVDSLFDTIQVFNASGELLIHFGKTGVEPGTFWLPAGIAVDDTGHIYIADSYNKRLQVFKLLKDETPPG